jgi:DNA polymerase III subunit epsilon
MREVILDTETTGLDPASGHRLIEICCLELDNHLPTGRLYHTLLQPERDIPDEASRIHGITADQLISAPLFAGVAEEFLAFLGDSPLVIHNAEFDLKFLNAELALAGHASLAPSRSVDTLVMARRRFPGARHSLDELCRRFNIDLSVRTKHGARVDAELLAQVYLELLGGRQAQFALAPGDVGVADMPGKRAARQRPTPLPERLVQRERDAHERFVAGDLQGDKIWTWGASARPAGSGLPD